LEVKERATAPRLPSLTTQTSHNNNQPLRYKREERRALGKALFNSTNRVVVARAFTRKRPRSTLSFERRVIIMMLVLPTPTCSSLSSTHPHHTHTSPHTHTYTDTHSLNAAGLPTRAACSPP